MRSITPVLLAEDNPDDALLFDRLLGKCGVALERVWNGKEAVERLTGCAEGTEELKWRLLFLDIKMPFLTGFEVLEWIRGQSALDPLAVIMLSSSNEPSDLRKARELGANGYLQKFPAPADLLTTLTSVVALSRPAGKQVLGRPGLL